MALNKCFSRLAPARTPGAATLWPSQQCGQAASAVRRGNRSPPKRHGAERPPRRVWLDLVRTYYLAVGSGLGAAESELR